LKREEKEGARVVSAKIAILEVTLSSLGVSGDQVGQAFGRFDLVVPAIPGSQVYRQAHSKEIHFNKKVLLNRLKDDLDEDEDEDVLDEWLVWEEGASHPLLMAPVGVDPYLPPTTGWEFYNKEDDEEQEDKGIICSNQPELPCGSITVSLSGVTKEDRSWCAGKYESTSLISTGRQVFKKPHFGYLFVRPGKKVWTIAGELNRESGHSHADPPPFRFNLQGGRANQSCPAHPSSSLNQQGDAINWESDKRVKGGVFLRCTTHDAVHNKWLVEQGRREQIPKEKVAALLCEEDKDGSCLLSLSDVDVQQEVASWNRGATEKIAHKLSSGFVQWLIKQGMDGHWEGKELGSFVWRKNTEGTVIFYLLSFETQKVVATWNPEAFEKVAHRQSFDFVQWLFKQRMNGHWKGKEVGSVVWRKNNEGIVIFSLLDFETQKQAALWNQEETNQNAHLTSVDFIQWLIMQARDGKWPKEDVASIVCRKNTDNKLVLATLDWETQKEIAMFDKAKTCDIVPYMEKEADFLKWLYQEAIEGRWDSEMVSKALIKEEVDGKVNISTRIRPEFELVSAGGAGDFIGWVLGRFDLVPGEEEMGCPVYKQAHSKEIPRTDKYMLYMYRLKDDWVVGYIKGGLTTELKASVGALPNQPPTTGWKYYGYDDETLSCIIPVTSPACCLTVSLSGAAKETQGKCEGKYKSIGLTSAGRPVFKLEGADCYLFIKPGRTHKGLSSWSVWSDFEGPQGEIGGTRYIKSGSAGLGCPAHPRCKLHKNEKINDWSFLKANENDKDGWEEGGVVVQCSVHDHS